jgi:hypothetical protein
VFEADRVGGVVCFVWVTTGCILEWRVVECPTCTAGRNCAGVVLHGLGLCTNAIFWLLGFAEFGMVTISLTVIALAG